MTTDLHHTIITPLGSRPVEIDNPWGRGELTGVGFLVRRGFKLGELALLGAQRPASATGGEKPLKFRSRMIRDRINCEKHSLVRETVTR